MRGSTPKQNLSDCHITSVITFHTQNLKKETDKNKKKKKAYAFVLKLLEKSDIS